jgi:hypothetical protein
LIAYGRKTIRKLAPRLGAEASIGSRNIGPTTQFDANRLFLLSACAHHGKAPRRDHKAVTR